MSIGLYDQALVNKIQKWTNREDLTITSPGETQRLFSKVADDRNDAPIQLPLISIRRDRTIQIQNKYKKPTTFDGVTLEASEHGIKSIENIPIGLTYQIDIYSRYMQEADEYLRNFVYNILNYPKLQIVIPYEGVNYEHESSIRLVGDVEDNSDIAERLIAGQFTRYTLFIAIDDAYLWSVPIRKPVKVGNIEVEHYDTNVQQ